MGGARAPCVNRLVEAHPAADEERRHCDIGIDLEGELVEVVHDCTCRLAAGRAGFREGGAQLSSGASVPKRTAYPSHSRSIASGVWSRISSLAHWPNAPRPSSPSGSPPRIQNSTAYGVSRSPANTEKRLVR